VQPESQYPGCLAANKSEAPEIFVHRSHTSRRASILGCESSSSSTSSNSAPRLYKNNQGEYVPKKPVVSLSW